MLLNSPGSPRCSPSPSALVALLQPSKRSLVVAISEINELAAAGRLSLPVRVGRNELGQGARQGQDHLPCSCPGHGLVPIPRYVLRG